jgi:hypothetical protein
VFRLVLLAVRPLSPEERDDVEGAVAGMKASFEALDPGTEERLAQSGGPPSLPTGSDLVVYTVLEDDGRTREQREVIAPLNEELAPGSEVALEGVVSTLFRTGPEEVSLHFADQVVAADWAAFWSQSPEGPAA